MTEPIQNIKTNADACRFLTHNFINLPLVKWEKVNVDPDNAGYNSFVEEVLRFGSEGGRDSEIMEDLIEDYNYFKMSEEYVNSTYGESKEWIIDSEFQQKYNQYWNSKQLNS